MGQRQRRVRKAATPGDGRSSTTRPRLYSFLDGAFSGRTVARERDVLRHGCVELQDAVRRRLCSAHAAAWVAMLPKDEQRALVRQGREAIKSAARVARREYRAQDGDRTAESEHGAPPPERRRTDRASVRAPGWCLSRRACGSWCR